MSERDFSFDGKKFKLGKINAFKQFHIVRRVGPILTELIPAMKEASSLTNLKDIEKLTDDQKIEFIGKFATPVMKGLSKLSDTDADLVLMGLLECVEIQQSTGNWAKVATNNMLMMQDLDLKALLNLAGRAFMFNLSGFFGALPQ